MVRFKAADVIYYSLLSSVLVSIVFYIVRPFNNSIKKNILGNCVYKFKIKMKCKNV